ncbi:MAG: hypothetical protein B1H05_02780 [Candidatus Cloacimonas sp. 4484_140]|nr:MAG: hypothetical protein B1H05_02780 [Candidatus Cloacimonas sp. 4484_140]
MNIMNIAVIVIFILIMLMIDESYSGKRFIKKMPRRILAINTNLSKKSLLQIIGHLCLNKKYTLEFVEPNMVLLSYPMGFFHWSYRFPIYFQEGKIIIGASNWYGFGNILIQKYHKRLFSLLTILIETYE